MQASRFGEGYRDCKPHCRIRDGWDEEMSAVATGDSVAEPWPSAESLELSRAQRMQKMQSKWTQHIETYCGESSMSHSSHCKHDRMPLRHPEFAAAIAPVHSHDRNWVGVLRGGTAPQRPHEMLELENKKGTVEQLQRLRQIQKQWPGCYDLPKVRKRLLHDPLPEYVANYAARQSHTQPLPSLQKSTQEHRHAHETAKTNDPDNFTDYFPIKHFTPPSDNVWDSTEASGNLDFNSGEGSGSEEGSLGSLPSTGRGSQKNSRSGSLGLGFGDAADSPAGGDSDSSSSIFNSRRSSSSGSHQDMITENPNLSGSGGACQSSGMSSKRSSLVPDEVPPTIPEESSRSPVSHAGALRSPIPDSGRASLRSPMPDRGSLRSPMPDRDRGSLLSTASQVAMLRRGSKASQGTSRGLSKKIASRRHSKMTDQQSAVSSHLPESESQITADVPAVTGPNPTNPAEKRWKEWRVFFAIEILDGFAEAYGKLPPAKEGTGVTLNIDGFGSTFADVTGLLIKRQLFAETAKKVGVGTLRTDGLLLSSLNEFLELIRTVYLEIQRSNPEVFWPKEELDIMKDAFGDFAPSGSLKLERLFELIEALGHEDLVEDLQSAEKQRFFVKIMKEQVGDEGGTAQSPKTLSFIQFLKVYNSAVLELQQAKRKAMYENELKAQKASKFTAGEMDDLRELHLCFSTAEIDTKKKSTVDRLRELLEGCGMRQLSEKEIDTVKKVVQEHPATGQEPSFEIFVLWMGEFFQHDIGGIATQFQKESQGPSSSSGRKSSKSSWDRLRGSSANVRKSFSQIMQQEEEEEKSETRQFSPTHQLDTNIIKVFSGLGGSSSASHSLTPGSATPKSSLSSNQVSRRGSSNTGVLPTRRLSKRQPDAGDASVDPTLEDGQEGGVLHTGRLPPDKAMLGRRVPRAISAEDSGDEGCIEDPAEIPAPRVTVENVGASEGLKKLEERKVKERPDPVALVNAAIQSLLTATDEETPTCDVVEVVNVSETENLQNV